jgi:hypothetical protein
MLSYSDSQLASALLEEREEEERRERNLETDIAFLRAEADEEARQSQEGNPQTGWQREYIHV